MPDYLDGKVEKDFMNTIRKYMSQDSKENLSADIRNFIKKYIKENSFTDNTDIFSEGFVNSLFAMDLIVYIEKNYHFKIDNEDLRIENFKSVNAIVQLIQNKIEITK